jgi:hypothetical protein
MLFYCVRPRQLINLNTKIQHTLWPMNSHSPEAMRWYPISSFILNCRIYGTRSISHTMHVPHFATTFHCSPYSSLTHSGVEESSSKPDKGRDCSTLHIHGIHPGTYTSNNGDTFPVTYWLDHEAVHSSPSSAKDKDVWNFISTSPYTNTDELILVGASCCVILSHSSKSACSRN